MRVIYFDGLCNLCNGFVDFLLRHDQKHLYKFAPLQGSTAASRLPVPLRTEPFSSVVLEDDGIFYLESSAALRALAGLGGIYKSFLVLLIIPGLLRDPLYRWVARNRYRWFGQRSTCRLPSEQEGAYFLD